jgi:hypothetical protein
MGALSSVDEDMVAESFELKGNYPNPFNPTTKIRFSNDRTSNVKVNVYSLKGEKVATIMNKEVKHNFVFECVFVWGWKAMIS